VLLGIGFLPGRLLSDVVTRISHHVIEDARQFCCSVTLETFTKRLK
jgi:hypothetical protein